MKVTPLHRLTGSAALGLLALTAACGTDSNSGTPAAGSSSSSSSSASAAAIQCATGTVNAEGSSAQANAMAVWISAYQKACSGATINYQPTGSGAGVTSFTGGRVPFAGSDSALKPEETAPATARCTGGQAIDLPMVTGPVALAYNLPGVKGLVLDAKTTAGIFEGTITSWDDPAIKALNSGVSLPSAAITAYHRSDESGTTDNVTKYLTAAGGGAWTSGTGKAWAAPGGVGAAKSQGVTQGVQSTQNSITYVEKSFADNAGLSTAKIDTGSGTPVALTGDTAAAAVAAATVTGTAPDLSLKLDYATKAAGAYPLILVTYEITCTKGLAAADAPLVKSFLSYTSSTAGQAAIANAGYAPLPDAIRSKVADAVAAL